MGSKKTLAAENEENKFDQNYNSVRLRLDQLAKLKDGWYNSEGIAPKEKELQEFGDSFEKFYDTTLPLPAIFPTFEGNIQLEWSVKEYEISLLIHLNEQKADLEILNLSTDENIEKTFQINVESQWNKINELLFPVLFPSNLNQ